MITEFAKKAEIPDSAEISASHHGKRKPLCYYTFTPY